MSPAIAARRMGTNQSSSSEENHRTLGREPSHTSARTVNVKVAPTNDCGIYALLVTTASAVLNEGEVAFSRICPGLPVDCTMARANPWKARRRLDL